MTLELHLRFPQLEQFVIQFKDTESALSDRHRKDAMQSLLSNVFSI